MAKISPKFDEKQSIHSKVPYEIQVAKLKRLTPKPS